MTLEEPKTRAGTHSFSERRRQPPEPPSRRLCTWALRAQGKKCSGGVVPKKTLPPMQRPGLALNTGAWTDRPCLPSAAWRASREGQSRRKLPVDSTTSSRHCALAAAALPGLRPTLPWPPVALLVASTQLGRDCLGPACHQSSNTQQRVTAFVQICHHLR